MVTNPGRALSAVATQFFLNGFVYAMFIPRLPEIRDRVGISTGGLGLVLTLGSISGIVGSLFAGRVVARFGSRRVMVGASLLSFAGLPVAGFATHPVVLVAGLVTVLFFDVFADVAMNVQGSVLSARRETPVMNRLHGVWSLASVIGGLLTVLLVAWGTTVPLHFVSFAVVLVLTECALWPFLLATDEAHVGDDGSDDDQAVGGSGWTPAHRRRAALLLGVGGAMAMAMEIAGGDWAALRLTDDLRAGSGLAAAGFVAFTVGMTVGRLGGDSVQVRIGVDRLVFATSVLAGIGFAVASLADVEGVVLVGFLVAGLGVSVQFPQLYDAAARLPGPPGSGFTEMLIGQRLAAVLTPLSIGALATTDAIDVGMAIAVVALPAAFVSATLAVIRHRDR